MRRLVCFMALILALASSAGAVSSSLNGDYNVGTSNVTLFDGVASKLPYGTHYVYWRDGQYRYIMAYGDVTLSGTTFTGTDCTVVRYETTNGYNSTYTWDVTEGESLTLRANGYMVYSDLGGYPELTDNGGKYYAQATLVGLCSFGLFTLWELLYHCRRR